MTSHTFLHFSIGYMAGTFAMLLSFVFKRPQLQSPHIEQQTPHGPLVTKLSFILLSEKYRASSRALAWMLFTLALGIWGLIPKLFSRITGLSSVSSWTNIFWGHGLLARLRPGGGLVIGGILILLSVTVQYAILVWLTARQTENKHGE